MEFQDMITTINEVVATCRSHSFCRSCPYWEKEKDECLIQMTANVGNTPEMW